MGRFRFALLPLLATSALACGSRSGEGAKTPSATMAPRAPRAPRAPMLTAAELSPFESFVRRTCPSFVDATADGTPRVLARELATVDAKGTHVQCLRVRVGQSVTCASGPVTPTRDIGLLVVSCKDKDVLNLVDVVE